jgi:predicted ATP-grasp superfamily ATP-dependent carboligase
MSILAKLRAALRERGLAATALHAADRVLGRLSGGRARLIGYAFVAQPLHEGPLQRSAAAARPRAGTELRPLQPGDPLAPALPRPPEVLARRWARGDECLGAIVKGELAGTLWTAQGSYDEDEVRCRYVLLDPQRTVWDYDVWVAPSHRGGRVLLRLWEAAAQRLVARGVTHSISRIALGNVASLASHARLGAFPIGRALFLRLGGAQLAAMSMSPYLHLSWRDDRAPDVLLRVPGVPAPPQRPAAGSAGKGPAAALVLGLDSHGLAVARALADAGEPTYAVCKDPPLPGASSNRVRRTFPVPYDEFLRFDDSVVPRLLAVRQELAQHPRVALIAINDRHVATIGRNLDALRAAFDISWADGAPTVLRLQQKSELEAFSRAQGLEYPRSALCEQPEPTAQALALRYPVILKPARPLSSFKTLLVQSAAALRQALLQQAHDLPILAQEYIAGGDNSLYFGALILDRGRVVHGMAGRKVASFPPARGQTTIAQTCTGPDAAEVLRQTERFFAGTGLSGPVSLELKHGPDGRWWVIEPTVGRTDFWAELCIGAGFNQPLLEFQLACGLPVEQPGPLRPCVWYDTERDPLAWVRLAWREGTLRPLARGQRFPYVGHGDPRPLRRALRSQAVQRFDRLLRTKVRT